MKIKQRFATHPMFDIDDLEWLENALHANIVRFDIGTGGKPQTTWEDRCACIGMIQNEPARALCSLLVWGDEQKQYKKVCYHLAGKMIKQCQADRYKVPKGYVDSLPAIAEKMAEMVLYLHLYNIWNLYSVEGRLFLFNLQINVNTYKVQFGKYQRLLIDELNQLVFEIANDIKQYRKNLKK